MDPQLVEETHHCGSFLIMLMWMCWFSCNKSGCLLLVQILARVFMKKMGYPMYVLI